MSVSCNIASMSGIGPQRWLRSFGYPDSYPVCFLILNTRLPPYSLGLLCQLLSPHSHSCQQEREKVRGRHAPSILKALTWTYIPLSRNESLVHTHLPRRLGHEYFSWQSSLPQKHTLTFCFRQLWALWNCERVINWTIKVIVSSWKR